MSAGGTGGFCGRCGRPGGCGWLLRRLGFFWPANGRWRGRSLFSGSVSQRRCRLMRQLSGWRHCADRPRTIARFPAARL